MKDVFVSLACRVKPRVRHAKLHNRDYRVVPTVMIVEGVHNGSKGPLYYPADEIRKSASLWDAKPVVIYHPPEGTACDETVLNERGVGQLMHTRWSDGKLKTESWVEEARVRAIDGRVHNAIEAETSLEGSTGLLVDIDPVEGEWNGERYVGIVRNLRPDHYAILPDQTGACSRAEGAGFLMNQSSEDAVDNEQSYDSVRDQIAALVRAARADTSLEVWVRDVYPDYVIFEQKQQLYKQGYEVKDDVVSLRGVPEPVVRVVSYKTKKGVVVNMSKEHDTMDKKKLVEELVGVKNGGFEGADRAELETLSEKTLRAMIVNAQAKAGAAEVRPPAAPKTLAEYLNTVPAEYAPVVRNGVAAYNRDHEALVQNVLKHPRNKYTVEQLRAKDLSELQVLNEFCAEEKPASQNDFGGQGGAPVANADAKPEDLLPLPVMNFESK